MRTEIVRADPTGNSTILVLSPVAVSERAAAAARLMALDGGWAEQVGFVSEDAAGARLDMMGGEFCGNASMSLAAFLAAERGIFEGELSLSVSGAPERVACGVRRDGEDWFCRVDMPLPESVRQEAFSLAGRTFTLWTARFPGIVHVIIPAGVISRAEAEGAVRKWTADTGADALGILLFSEKRLEMDPLVCVRATDSAVWERGCASGTSAVCAYLACASGGAARAEIRQPGGVLGGEARSENGRIASLRISGRVRLLGRGCREI